MLASGRGSLGRAKFTGSREGAGSHLCALRVGGQPPSGPQWPPSSDSGQRRPCPDGGPAARVPRSGMAHGGRVVSASVTCVGLAHPPREEQTPQGPSRRRGPAFFSTVAALLWPAGLFRGSFSLRASPLRSVLTTARPGLSLGPNPRSLSLHTRPLTARVHQPPLHWEALLSSVSVVTSLGFSPSDPVAHSPLRFGTLPTPRHPGPRAVRGFASVWRLLLPHDSLLKVKSPS